MVHDIKEHPRYGRPNLKRRDRKEVKGEVVELEPNATTQELVQCHHRIISLEKELGQVKAELMRLSKMHLIKRGVKLSQQA